jgi:hypothetical protein
MTKKKSTRGGPREGSGRKPIDDKVIALTIYPRESWVKKVGKAKAKAMAKQAIEDAYNVKISLAVGRKPSNANTKN